MYVSREDNLKKEDSSRQSLVFRVARVEVSCPSTEERDIDPIKQLCVLWVMSRPFRTVSSTCQLHYNLPVCSMVFEDS